MKNLVLILAIAFSSLLTAQEALQPVPLQETENMVNSGYVVVVTTDPNLAKTQEQYDIFENGRKYFAERNIQPYLVTPQSVQSFFKEKTERFMKFGDYQKLQQADSDFVVIILDKDFNRKYTSETPITPMQISEVMD